MAMSFALAPMATARVNKCACPQRRTPEKRAAGGWKLRGRMRKTHTPCLGQGTWLEAQGGHSVVSGTAVHDSKRAASIHVEILSTEHV